MSAYVQVCKVYGKKAKNKCKIIPLCAIIIPIVWFGSVLIKSNSIDKVWWSKIDHQNARLIFCSDGWTDIKRLAQTILLPLCGVTAKFICFLDLFKIGEVCDCMRALVKCGPFFFWKILMRNKALHHIQAVFETTLTLTNFLHFFYCFEKSNIVLVP